MNTAIDIVKKQFMTPKEVAGLLNCKQSTIYSWAKLGKTPCFKIGGLLRFDPAEIDAWIKSSKVRLNKNIKIKPKTLGRKDIKGIMKKALNQ